MINIFQQHHAEGNVKLLIKGKKLTELTSIPAYSLLLLHVTLHRFT